CASPGHCSVSLRMIAHHGYVGRHAGPALYDDSAPAGFFAGSGLMLVAWSQLGGAFTYHIRVIEANASPKPEHLSKKQDGGETEGQILHFGTSESCLASGATSSSGTSS